MPIMIEGLVPILATPFLADGTLDRSSLRRLAAFQVEHGADGIGLFGLASEAFALTDSERLIIMADVREVVGAEQPLVAGAGSTGVEPAIEQACETVEAGADVLMVLPPHLVPADGDGLVDYYGRIAAAVDVPIMIQDAPVASRTPMSVDLLRDLAKLDGVDYIKVEEQPTALKVGRIVEEVGPALTVLGGQNALFLLDELRLGAVGTMPACELTDGLRRVLDLRAADRHDEAAAAFTALLPLIRFGLQGGVAWAVHKHLLHRAGIIASATVRTPARPLDPATIRALELTAAATDLAVTRGWS